MAPTNIGTLFLWKHFEAERASNLSSNATENLKRPLEIDRTVAFVLKEQSRIPFQVLSLNTMELVLTWKLLPMITNHTTQLEL